MDLLHASNPPKKAESLNMGCIHAELVKEIRGRKMFSFLPFEIPKILFG